MRSSSRPPLLRTPTPSASACARTKATRPPTRARPPGHSTADGSLSRPRCLLTTDCNLLHVRHISSELLADRLDWVGTDSVVDGEEHAVVDAVGARRVELCAHDVRILLRHEVGEQRTASLVVQVAAVLGSVADDGVHLVKLLARDGIGDERRLVKRLVVRRLGLHARVDHRLKRELHACLHHGDHEYAVIKVLLLGDGHRAGRGGLEGGLRRLLPPFEQIDVVVVPVLHHRLREVAGDDIVLVFVVERFHDDLELLRELKGLHLRGVVEAVHHAGDAAVLKRLGDRLPAILDEFGGVSRLDALRDHLVEAEQAARLQHATQDRLLAHQVTLDLGDEGALQHTGAVATRRGRVRLRLLQTQPLWVVLRVHSNERRHTKAALVLLAHLSARALRRHHDDGEVGTDLHALLDDIEAVAVRQGRALLHHRHHRVDHCTVLLVWRQVEHNVSLRDEILVRADGEAVGSGVDEARALRVNRTLAQRVAHIAAGVTHVEALVEALSAAADDHNLLASNRRDAARKLLATHEAAAGKLVQLPRLRERVVIVDAFRHPRWWLGRPRRWSCTR
mmetsp:Transcript_20104/g.51170  ORF Transcript_20104/g.51170 Transcript_20104/m.51170 type:complete len:564 (-) Transcript_20104:13-1704(-)